MTKKQTTMLNMNLAEALELNGITAALDKDGNTCIWVERKFFKVRVVA